MDINLKKCYRYDRQLFFSLRSNKLNFNPLRMFITSNETEKYNTTTYTFAVRYKSHNAHLRTTG
jgi:hypothetical protein